MAKDIGAYRPVSPLSVAYNYGRGCNRCQRFLVKHKKKVLEFVFVTLGTGLAVGVFIFHVVLLERWKDLEETVQIANMNIELLQRVNILERKLAALGPAAAGEHSDQECSPEQLKKNPDRKAVSDLKSLAEHLKDNGLIKRIDGLNIEIFRYVYKGTEAECADKDLKAAAEEDNARWLLSLSPSPSPNPILFEQHLASTWVELARIAKQKEAESEQRYKRYKVVSYILIPLGILLNLVGRVIGLGEVASND